MSDHRHWTRPQLLWWLAAALVAYGLKRHYSVASAAELAWMLRPVSMLLQLITGCHFHASAAGEWQSEAAGIVLVKGCAGINFMILSFVGWCWLARPSRKAPLTLATLYIEWPVLLAASLLLAWATALTINVLRILTAMSLGPLLNAWLGPEEVHRLLGLAIYLPALALQLTAGERQNRGSAALVAAGSYAALMVVTPLLTGNAFDHLTDYVRHSAMVLLLVAPVAAWGLRHCHFLPVVESGNVGLSPPRPLVESIGAHPWAWPSGFNPWPVMVRPSAETPLAVSKVQPIMSVVPCTVRKVMSLIVL